MRDFERFCAFRVDDMKNFDLVLACMQSHAAELEPECKAEVDAAAELIGTFHKACDDDIKASCPDVVSGNPQQTKDCIVEHLADLSKGCLAELSTLLRHHEKPGIDKFMQMRMGGMGQSDSEEMAEMDEGHAQHMKGEYRMGMRTDDYRIWRGVTIGLAIALFCTVAFVTVRRVVARRRAQQVLNSGTGPITPGTQYIQPAMMVYPAQMSGIPAYGYGNDEPVKKPFLDASNQEPKV